ncbi:polyprenyl diphosphate synthase [Halovenus rubra]|uniref:Tritrans,polycis-undecaprenyl-diphosphate synthase (geranylgeranyl-diphosphate specific) n=2 Tax=Halovenus rubra TaxID=869890 RepID=A0ABD5X6H8_9EURY|nr:polyprenyl diphosphate synthase [Halovenus rubra]
MLPSLREWTGSLYEHILEREISKTPTHVAVIQDGNRRYASQHGGEPSDGHRAGAKTTEALLEWCDELDVEEVTLYTFSTENFDRPKQQREELFDLVASKLREFADADRVHDQEVRIRAIGETHRLPDRVQDAIAYARDQTEEYDRLLLNIALAYGGRAEMLTAARTIAQEVADNELDTDSIGVTTVEKALYDGPTHDVDLIVRSGGDERTSNFLPWQANGNEAAVYFSTPYWPEFSRIDFLRSIRTYEHRERSWRQTRARRARELLHALGTESCPDARQTFNRFRSALPVAEQEHPDDMQDKEVVD